MIDSIVAVFFVLAVVVLISIWLANEFRFLKKLGAALIAILLGMLMSNIGIIPGESVVYDFLESSGVSAAVVLILLSVDIRTIKKAGPLMLKAFCFAALGSTLGSIIMALILSSSLGPETWKLSGHFTATYIGGGMNFAALKNVFQTDSDLYSAGQAADVTLTAFWYMICLAAPLIFLSKSKPVNNNSPTPSDSDQTKTFTLEHALSSSGSPVHITQIAASLCITFGSIWLSQLIAEKIPVIPDILWLTTIILILSQLPFIKKLSGNAMLGNYILLLFLASNGAKSILANIIEIGPAIFLFPAGLLAIHGLIIFGLGRLCRIDMGTLAVASQASIGGSASAVAIAGARGYSDRILPGIAVGLLGYAIGNYLGFGVAKLMQAIL
ncbi:MAG: DUF819 family protein [Planctomycetes bacterium]|nr:DUF819 family protein [Planctomycetota bacterium]